MPNDDDLDSKFDDYWKRQKTGLEAEERWSDTAARIADALEHQSMNGLLVQLAAMGKSPKIPEIKHRKDCAICAVTRQLVEALRMQVAQGAIIPANGKIIR